MTRYCSRCRRKRPIREFDLGGGQLSTTCLGCAHERLRTEDDRERAQRNAEIAAMEGERRELIAKLVKLDAKIASRPWSNTEIAAMESERRELIAKLVKLDANIADRRARPMPPRIVLDDGGEVGDSVFDDDDLGADLGGVARDEMS